MPCQTAKNCFCIGILRLQPKHVVLLQLHQCTPVEVPDWAQ